MRGTLSERGASLLQRAEAKVKQEKKEASARAEQLPDIYATLQQKYADVKDFIFPQDLEQHIRDWQRKLREC